MQDLSNYTKAYYQRDNREGRFAAHGIIRPDQLAALCYAVGWAFWGEEEDPRDPGHILSIGCGAGALEKQLEDMGFTVTGVDPSAGARELYQGSTLVPTWTKAMVRDADTVIFCESIEHLPIELITEIFDSLTPGTRVIIVNWVEYHPIVPTPDDDWDHITLIDDEFYDKLSVGKKVILRRGSHLVLEVK